MSTTPQYHFVSKTASNFNIAAVSHLALAVFTSMFDADVSAAIAVMGIFAVLNSNIALLLLYLLFTPASLIVDIVRMNSVKHSLSSGVYGFFVFLEVVEMLIKVGAVFFGYQVYSSASQAEGSYEQINQGGSTGGNNFQPSQPDPFKPSSYTAPPPPPAAPAPPVQPSGVAPPPPGQAL